MTSAAQKQPTIYLVEGPVGAGKSTFTSQLSATNAAPRLILDEWMKTLFSPDRPDANVIEWYEQRKRRCLEQIRITVNDLLDVGCSVVLELGLIRQIEREAFYNFTDTFGYHLEVYVLNAPKEVRRQRIRRRNTEKGSTFSMTVSEEIFELASSLWEQPDEQESIARNIHFIDTNE